MWTRGLKVEELTVQLEYQLLRQRTDMAVQLRTVLSVR